MNNSETAAKLIKEAKAAMEFSYSPYSKFKVGAALLTSDGKVFTGCNVENSTFGATNCAERTAVFKAVSEGYKDFAAIAIVGSGGDLTFPCGICRQVLFEFSPSITVILQDGDGKITAYPLTELLPFGFRL